MDHLHSYILGNLWTKNLSPGVESLIFYSSPPMRTAVGSLHTGCVVHLESGPCLWSQYGILSSLTWKGWCVVTICSMLHANFLKEETSNNRGPTHQIVIVHLRFHFQKEFPNWMDFTKLKKNIQNISMQRQIILKYRIYYFFLNKHSLPEWVPQ